MTRPGLCKYTLPLSEFPLTIKIAKSPDLLGAAPSSHMSILPPGATAWTRKTITDRSTPTHYMFELPRVSGLAAATSNDALAANDPLEIFVYRFAIA